MPMLRYLIVASLLLVFGGCVGTSPAPAPVQAKKAPPAWIDNPPQTDASYLYGVAIDENRDTAVKAALNNMVSKLGISIESSFQTTKELQYSFVKTEMKNQIKSDVAKIKVNNYEVTGSERMSYREFAVMVRTDKQKFAAGLKAGLENKTQSIKTQLAAAKKDNVLGRYNTTKKMAAEANAMVTEIAILSQLDTTFATKTYMDFVDGVNKTYLNEKSKLNFRVTGDGNAQEFVKKAKDALGKQSFNISNASNANTVNIKMSASTRITEGSMKIAVIKLNVDVLNGSRQVGGNSLIYKQRFSGSTAGIYKNSSLHFEQDMEKEGLFKTLGINLEI
jgi:hypothetical protein